MSKSESPVERLTALARRHGFDGTSGQELLAFLETRLAEGRQFKLHLSEAIQSMEGLSGTPAPLMSSDSVPAWIQHVATEACRRIGAQQTTIEVLMVERQHPTPGATS